MQRRWLDVDTLMAIRSLPVRVRRVLEGMRLGAHRSVRRGSSVEFAEYRGYVPGDDLRRLDWKRMARSGRAYVRQYEDETSLDCVLVSDLSASMAFGGGGAAKADWARTFLGTLGMFLLEAGEAVGLVRCGGGMMGAVPLGVGSRRSARWWPVLDAAPTGDAGPVDGLRLACGWVRRRSLVVVVSDFLGDAEEWEAEVRRLVLARNEVVLVEVLSREELEFPYEGAWWVKDPETGLGVRVDGGAARDEYLLRFGEHRKRLDSLAMSSGARLLRCTVEAPFEPVVSGVAGILRGVPSTLVQGDIEAAQGRVDRRGGER
ncbi:MAG: hypothetical protein RIS92_1827 [Verrucomicrobiota bacterium]